MAATSNLVARLWMALMMYSFDRDRGPRVGVPLQRMWRTPWGILGGFLADRSSLGRPPARPPKRMTGRGRNALAGALIPRGRGVRRQITYGAIRVVAPNTTNPITNATIVKPITWRTLSFAIASRGSNQNGWIMFATPSPTATAMEINPR